MAQMRLLITDNGTHPPEKWAEVIADDLIQIEPTASAESAQAGLALRHAMIAELIPVFADAQAAEREGRHGQECHCSPHVDALSEAVKRAANKSPFGKHFRQPHVLERIRTVCGIHTETAMQIEAEHKRCNHKHDKEKGQTGNGHSNELKQKD
jgi:hypothetical protein